MGNVPNLLKEEAIMALLRTQHVPYVDGQECIQTHQVQVRTPFTAGNINSPPLLSAKMQLESLEKSGP